jgi:hypothetical protein
MIGNRTDCSQQVGSATPIRHMSVKRALRRSARLLPLADGPALGESWPLPEEGTSRLVCCASDRITRQWETESGVEPAKSQ